MSKHILPERYEVTPEGRVFSYTKWRGEDVRELSQLLDQDGYPCVRVVINGRRRRVAVHRLVCRMFHGPQPAPGYEVRHLDGNRLNPAASNLAWGTRQDNADDRSLHGRTSMGDRHSASIKSSTQAERTREFHRSKKESVNV